MAKGKYSALEEWLKSQKNQVLAVTFSQIEKIIEAELPKSASAHRAWWSNNPSNSVATYAWLNAGYKTADVDMAGRKLVFRKADLDKTPPDDGSGPPAGLAEAPAAYKPKTGLKLEDVYGFMKGTVTIAPGVDLTEPISEVWAADNEKWTERFGE
ncbi:MAG: hypothetical protein AAFR11_12230 [Pseudomonadota bacterium]